VVCMNCCRGRAAPARNARSNAAFLRCMPGDIGPVHPGRQSARPGRPARTRCGGARRPDDAPTLSV
jgi:hypothetical protein